MSIKKGTILVLVANLINLFMSLLTGFILPKFLSIDTYASIKLFQLYVTYLGVFSLGYADGVNLRLGGKKIEKLNSEEISSEFKTFKIFQFIVTFSLIIVSIIIKNEMMLLCSLVILPVNIGGYLKNLYQAVGKFDLYSKFMNVNMILTFVINIFLLFIIKSDNYYLYIIGYIISYFIYWLYVEYTSKKVFYDLKVKPNKKYFKENIKNGFLLMLGNFGNIIFTSIDRLFVKNILGSIKFAYYSFAVSIENLLNVFITPITTVLYNYLCQKNKTEQVLKLKKSIMVFGIFILVSFFPAKFIIQIFLTKYIPSIRVLSILFLAQFASILVRTIHINIFKVIKKQNLYFKIMMIMIGLSIVLNIIFYLMLGSLNSFAIATLITNFIWFIIGELLLKKYRMKFFDYFYILIESFLFLVCSLCFNPIIGFIIFIITSVFITLIFEKLTFNFLISEVLNYFKKN